MRSAKRLFDGLGLVAVFATATVAHAAAAKDIFTPLPRVIAPRGGVLFLPLWAERPGDQWPQKIDVRLADGRVVRAEVAWVGPLDDGPGLVADRRRTWTGDPGRLLVRPVRPTDDTSAAGSGTPYLVARLPLDGDGDLRLGRRTVPANWWDLPPTPDKPGPALERVAAPDRPDPDSPFEYWRWVLLAEHLDRAPPGPPSSSDLEALVALHTAELWRIGLARLDDADPEAASAVRRLLTATCRDGARTVACWVADAGRVAELLAYLLNSTRDDREMLRLIGAWIEAEPKVVWWPESRYGDLVRIDMINRGEEPELVSFRWSEDDIPIALRLDPGRLERTYLERPPLPTPHALARDRDVIPVDELLIDVARQTHRVTVGRRLIAARPPGIFIGPFVAPLTLRGALSGLQRPVPVDRATFVQIRRLGGRWEVFFDCRRPYSTGAPVLGAPGDGPLVELRGSEAVTLVFGPPTEDGGPTVSLTVPETGWHELRAGTNDSTLEIHRRSYEDRWYARIVVPEAWLVHELGEPALIGFVRAHGDSDALETAPGQSLPWAPAIGRIAVDVTRWDER